jgi:hypothetical protein
VRLSLGRVEGAAQVYVNHRLADPEITPRGEIEIGRLLHPGSNIVEVVLTTTLKNRAVSLLPLATLSRPVLAATPGTQPYGLFGPVRLQPYGRATFTLPRL